MAKNTLCCLQKDPSFNNLFAPDQLMFPKLTFCSVSTQVAASCLGGTEMRAPPPFSINCLILKLPPLRSAANLLQVKFHREVIKPGNYRLGTI